MSVTCNDGRVRHRVDEGAGHAVVPMLREHAPPCVEWDLGHVTPELQRGAELGLRGVVGHDDTARYPVLPGDPRQGLGEVSRAGRVDPLPESLGGAECRQRCTRLGV